MFVYRVQYMSNPRWGLTRINGANHCVNFGHPLPFEDGIVLEDDDYCGIAHRPNLQQLWDKPLWQVLPMLDDDLAEVAIYDVAECDVQGREGGFQVAFRLDRAKRVGHIDPHSGKDVWYDDEVYEDIDQRLGGNDNPYDSED